MLEITSYSDSRLTLLLGQLERTLLHKWWEGSKLRQLLTKKDCPPMLKKAQKLVQHAYMAEKDEAEEPFHGSCPLDLVEALNNQRPRCTSRYQMGGKFYNRESTPPQGNSLILYRHNSEDSWWPAKIKYIYRTEAGVFFAVRPQLQLRDGEQQESRKWLETWRVNGFDAAIYSTGFGDRLEMIATEQVVGHYAMWNFDSDTSLVLNIN